MSAQKSTVMLFTPQTKQSRLHPTAPLNGSPLHLDRNPKILGVTFDPYFHIHQHVKNTASKAKPKLNILRQLCCKDWGQQKETIMLAFKVLIPSLFTYAATIWFPNASETSINKLQVTRNSALCIATRCVKMAAIDHLHTEAKALKVE